MSCAPKNRHLRRIARVARVAAAPWRKGGGLQACQTPSPRCGSAEPRGCATTASAPLGPKRHG
eukprot:67991-Prymnesium_polylepis.1